ncbi:MAG: replicative DNA helicase [Gammaproteobacteria bacterium]
MTAIAELPAISPKLPPQALEAEQSVLGGLLLDNGKWDQISDQVGEADFYHQNHRIIYQAIIGLLRENTPVDVVTVGQRLEKDGGLDQAGGAAYISMLANNTPGVANISAYARIVRECAILRALIAVAGEIADNAYTPHGKTPRQVLDHAEKLVFDISARDGRNRRGFVAMPELAVNSFERIRVLAESGEALTGIPTGFTRLDDMTSGLQRGDLVIVAGRPSMGKTALALNIAEYAAVGKKLAVAMFSMEMPAEHLAMRLLSSVSGIDSNHIRTGRLQDNEWPRLNAAVATLKDARIFVDDTAGLTPLEILSRSRKLCRENEEVSLIIVDYLQLMESAERNETRATEIAGITRSLKMLAKELNLPVVALSQLNRGLEQRPNKRPVMSDLRESGAIEQDADVIFFIYRDEVYNEESEDKGTAEVIIGKQRNGPIGSAKLTFEDRCTRFRNYADPSARPDDMPPYSG